MIFAHLFAVLAAAPVYAGDPCPIDFRVSNLGPLSKPGAVPIAEDAVFTALTKHLANADCVTVTVAKAANHTLPLAPSGEGLQTWRLQELLMDDKGSFRCEDAHTVLVALSAVAETGHVIYQRGTRRVLLTTAGWGTTCMEASALEAGGPAAIAKFWDGATGKLVQYRYDNP
jgi:hypothetical protein